VAKDLTQLTDNELFDAIVQPKVDAQARSAAQTAVGLGMQYNADNYASAIRLAPQLGTSPVRLMQDPRALQAMQAEMSAFEEIKKSPTLQAWVLEDPDNALLAHDDFGYLRALSTVFDYLPDVAPVRGLERGLRSVAPSITKFMGASGRLADLGRVMGERAIYDEIDRKLAAGEAIDQAFLSQLVPQTQSQREGLTPGPNIANYLRYAEMDEAERARIRSGYDTSIQDNRDAIAQLVAAGFFYQSQYGEGAKLDRWSDFPSWLAETVFEQAPIMLPLAAISAMSGGLGLLAVPATGEAMGRAETLAAQIDAGQNAASAEATRARESAGFLYGAAELLGPVGRIARGFFREIPEQLAERAVRGVLARSGRSFAANAAEEALNEVLQDAVVELFVEGEVDLTWDGLREKMITALTAAATGGVYGTVFELGANRRISRLQQEAQQSGQEIMTIRELNRIAPDSKLRQRSPEKFRQFLQTAGMGETFFWVDAAQLQEQIATGQTSLAELELTQQQVDDAVAAGDKVGVSAAAFTAKIAGTNLGTWFEANASVRKEGYTQTELEEIQQLAEEIRTEAAADAAQLSETSAKRRQVYEASYNQLRSAGVAHERAKANASLHAAAITTLSERLGVDLPGLLNITVEGEPQRLARQGFEADGVRDTARQQIETRVYTQLVRAGKSPAEARAGALLHAAFFDTISQRMSVEDMSTRFALDIIGPASPTQEGFPARVLQQPALPDLSTPEDQVRMPIDDTLPPDQVRAQIQALTEENIPIVDELTAAINARFGTTGGGNVKALSKVTQKASRPSILAKKPWHTVAHIRDSYRFKTVIKDFRDIPEILQMLLDRGIQLVKVDTNKLFEPKEWGWRIVAFDLVMPNGQLVEWYLPLEALEAQKKAEGHLIFEEWRNKTDEEITAQRDEYRAAIARSYNGYTEAFRKSLAEIGYDSIEEARADWSSVEADISSRVSTSASSSGMMYQDAVSSMGTSDIRNQEPSGDMAQSSPSSPNTLILPSAVRSANTIDAPPSGEIIQPSAADDKFRVLKQGEARREPESTGRETGVQMPTNLASAAKLALDNRFKTGRDFKLALQAMATEGLTDFDDATAEKLSDFAFEDALEAVQDNMNAIGWYDRKVTAAKNILREIYPELTPGSEAEFVFTWALAVTSNGVKVVPNFQLAAQVYEQWRTDGTFPRVRYGTATEGINIGLQMFFQLREQFDSWEAMRDYMVGRHPVRDIEARTGIAVGGEAKDEIVAGAAVLGPKIGNGFFSNLYGYFDMLTMDRWLMRTVGRWRGTLITVNEELVAQNRDEVRALLGAMDPADLAAAIDHIRAGLSRPQQARLDGIQPGPDMSDADTDLFAELIRRASVKPEWRDVMNAMPDGDLLRRLGNRLDGNLDGQNEDPSGARDRTFLRKVFGMALDRLRAEPGMDQLTMADLQALLWYPEKLLYDSAKKKPGEEIKSYEDDEAPDYENAARALYQQKVGRPYGDELRGAERGADDAGSAATAGVEGAEGTRRLAQSGARLRGRDGRVVTLGGREVSPVAVFGTEARPVYEVDDPGLFGDLIRSAKAALGPIGAQVTAYDDYTGKRLFLFDDGASGFALDGDDIISVFSSPNSQPGVVETMMPVAVAEGGSRLDAFNTFLPKVYARAGFRAVARLAFNRDYAPPGWDYGYFAENFGNSDPDIAFMVYDPANASEVTDNVVAEYDDGMAAQQAALAETLPLQQDARGQITFDIDTILRGGDVVISMFEKADASTFMHEAAHLYLQIILEAGGATAEGAAMLGQINRWLGRDERDTSQFTVDQHEAFAQAFEGYLMEGKAPTRALGSAFESMRKWLVALYRNLTGLGMRPSSEIKEVFDQILATDQELAAARAEADAGPLFDAPPPGMSAEEWEAYRNSARRSEDEATRRLLAKTMDKIRRRRSREWAVERKAMLPQVAEELAATPLYRLLGTLTARGSEATRLDKDELTRVFGEDVLKDLARSKIGGARNVYQPQGMPLKLAAEAFGFKSQNAMVEALRAAVRFEAAVELEADRRMEDKYGDVLSPEALRDEAMAAIANTSHAETTAREAAVLGRALGRQTRWQRQNRDSRQQAEQIVNRMTVREVMQYRSHMRAAQKAARDAQRALAGVVRKAGPTPQPGATTDLSAAYRAKQKQLLNEHIYRIARERSMKIEKAIRRFRRMQKKSIRENIGAPYINTIDTLLDQYELGKLTQKQIAERKSLAELINVLAEQDRLDEMGVAPEVLLASRKIPYTELTSEHMEALIDSVDNIAHMGRKATGARREAEQNRIAALVDEITDETNKHLRDRKTPRTVSGRNRLVRNFRQSVLWVLNADTTLRLLDGGKTLGPAYRAIKQRVDDGAARLQERREAAMREMQQLYLDRYDMKTIRAMREARYIKELGDTFSKWDILALALNSGNRDNWERMTNSEAKGAFDPDALNAVFNRELNDNDWQFVQSVWDYINGYWGEISALEERATGVTPKKVPAEVMADAPDFVRGGYYPIKYDPQLSTLARDHEVRTTALETLAGKFSKSQTKHGHTMSRMTTTGEAVVIDIGVFERHVMQVIHDLELREPVIQATKVLRGIRDLMISKGMQEDYDAMEIWLADVAAGDATNAHGMETTFRWLRRGFTVAKLGFNLRTALLQPLGMSQSMVVVGKEAMIRGMKSYLQSPMQWSEYAQANSAVMRERIRTFDKDINIVTGEIAAGLPAQKGFERFVNTITPWSFWLMQRAQYWAVDLPTFVAAYERSLREGKTEKDAITAAEVEVRRAQGSGLISDRGMVERGTIGRQITRSELPRLFTVLASYMFAKFNVAAERTALTDFKSPQAIMSLAVDYALLFAVEAALIALIFEDWDEEDETPYLQKVAVETGYTMLGTFPVVRDLASMNRGFEAGAYASYLSVFGDVFDAMSDVVAGETDLRTVTQAVGAGGTLFHFPSSQINRVLRTLFDEDGNMQDVGLIEALAGFAGVALPGR